MANLEMTSDIENYLQSIIPNYASQFQAFTISILILAFISSALLSFGEGANSSATQLAAAVGSGAMTVRTACIVGTFCEIIGAVLLSGEVIQTITTKIFNTEEHYRTHYNSTFGLIDPPLYDVSYCNKSLTSSGSSTCLVMDQALMPEAMYMIGAASVAIGAGSWQIIASYAGLPVSGTHSTVGALIGFSLTARGPESLMYNKLGKIIMSWFISPVFSGIVCIFCYYPIKTWIINSSDPLAMGKKFYAIIWAIATFISVGGMLTTKNPLKAKLKGIDEGMLVIYLWSAAAVLALLVFLVIHALIKLKKINFNSPKNEERQRANTELLLQSTVNEASFKPVGVQVMTSFRDMSQNDDDPVETKQLFTSLQWLSTICSSLGHGGNDVGNCIGPLVVAFTLYNRPLIDISKASAPLVILFYGGACISVGLWLFGRNIMKTIDSLILSSWKVF